MKLSPFLRFLILLALTPAVVGIYLARAKPEASAADPYQPVEIGDLVDTPLPPDAASVDQLPRAAQKADWKNVMLEGEMLIPPSGMLAPNEFLLLPPRADPTDVSKRSVTAPWQFVLVRMTPDKKVQPVPGRLRVFGQFRANFLRRPGGAVWSVYQVDCFWTQIL